MGTLIQEEAKYKLLRDRMDSDMRKSLLDPYVMKDSEGNPNTKAFSSITPNLPKTYLDRSVAFMGTAKRRFDIRKVDNADQKLLEDSRKVIYPLNDEILAEQQFEPLEFCLNYFACIRGWISAIVLMQQDGTLYAPDIRSIDSRWLMWEYDSRGMKWAAWRSRYPADYIKDLWGITGLDSKEDIDVYIRWTREKYEVWVAEYGGKDEIKSYSMKGKQGWGHKLGMCPVIVAPVPTRPNMIGGVGTSASTDLQYQGESLYAWNRELYDKLAELVSIWATLNKMQVLSPIVFIGRRKFTTMPFGLAAVIKLEKGEEIKELPTKQMAATAERLFAQLQVWLQEGSLPNTEFGHGMDRESAMGWQARSDTRNTIFQPRFDVKRTFFKKANRMLRYQINNNCYERAFSLELKDFAFEMTAAEKKAWSSKYYEDVVYSAVSPEENIANHTLAKSAKDLGIFSRMSIARDIVKVEDPAGEILQADIETVEEVMPALKAARLAYGMAKRTITDDEIKEKMGEIINFYLDKMLAGEIPAILPPGGGQPSMANLNANIAGAPGKPSGPEKVVTERVRRRGVEAGRQGQNSNEQEA